MPDQEMAVGLAPSLGDYPQALAIVEVPIRDEWWMRLWWRLALKARRCMQLVRRGWKRLNDNTSF